MTRDLENDIRTRVVNIEDNKQATYIGKKTKERQKSYFASPFSFSSKEDREITLQKYSDYFYYTIEIDSIFLGEIMRLKNRTLGCTCKPLACHGDIIANFLDNELEAFINKKKYEQNK